MTSFLKNVKTDRLVYNMVVMIVVVAFHAYKRELKEPWEKTLGKK